ncbi:MAG: hypothetical protein HXX08_11510 [Chloroflexi bacterium]|uniref:Uncharacterized protein n=1 Tax=Candidatus Chlorohelix allophototropha TaxID=3003348 RepID=A0A8T7LZM7_9CHLR|nr:hypothetical protein [Chloroflexota bacterium]WJW65865.1 hypothetical protein OZ401_001644 [Chloroflexota bacterium L227-S17]
MSDEEFYKALRGASEETADLVQAIQQMNPTPMKPDQLLTAMVKLAACIALAGHMPHPDRYNRELLTIELRVELNRSLRSRGN